MNRQGLVLTYILGQVPIFLQEWQKSVQIDITIYVFKESHFYYKSKKRTWMYLIGIIFSLI